MRVIKQPAELQSKVGIVLEVWNGVVEHRSLLDGGNAGLQADGLSQAKKINAVHAEREARADAGGSGRGVKGGGAASDPPELRAETDIVSVAAGLTQRIQNCFGGLVAIQVLNHRIHPG